MIAKQGIRILEFPLNETDEKKAKKVRYNVITVYTINHKTRGDSHDDLDTPRAAGTPRADPGPRSSHVADRTRAPQQTRRLRFKLQRVYRDARGRRRARVLPHISTWYGRGTDDLQVQASRACDSM